MTIHDRAEQALHQCRDIATMYRLLYRERLQTTALPVEGSGRSGKPESRIPKGHDQDLAVALIGCARHIVVAHDLLGLPGQTTKPWFHTRLGTFEWRLTYKRKTILVGKKWVKTDQLELDQHGDPIPQLVPEWHGDVTPGALDLLLPEVIDGALGALRAKIAWTMTVDRTQHRQALGRACTYVTAAAGDLDKLRGRLPEGHVPMDERCDHCRWQEPVEGRRRCSTCISWHRYRQCPICDAGQCTDQKCRLCEQAA